MRSGSICDPGTVADVSSTCYDKTMTTKAPARPTSTARLITRLRNLGLSIPAEAQIERTYASRAYRASGAWSWYILVGSGQIGSQAPVTALLREPRLMANREHHAPGDVSIDRWEETLPRHRDMLVAEEPEPAAA